MNIIKGLEITKNINIIENLKSELLYKVADLFCCTDIRTGSAGKITDAADLIILLYLLAEKMGYSHEAVDKKIVERIKEGIKSEKNEGSEWRGELKLLLKNFEDSKT